MNISRFVICCLLVAGAGGITEADSASFSEGLPAVGPDQPSGFFGGLRALLQRVSVCNTSDAVHYGMQQQSTDLGLGRSQQPQNAMTGF